MTTTAARPLRSYDHRLRHVVHETGDAGLAIAAGVPRSTARGWTRSAPRPVVSLCDHDRAPEELRRDVAQLRARLHKVAALLRLLLAVLRALGITLKHRRLAEESAKTKITRALRKARASGVAMTVALGLIGLSARRFREWSRELDSCSFDDIESCPRTSPQQLTREEVRTIKEMVTSAEFRHVPTGTLAILAQRLGRVYAAPSTWYRLVRTHKWRRHRYRIHPRKPKIGIRAGAPNEIWHIDTTIVRLLSGAHVYLHAVIDNFSRRILAWRIAERCNPANTVEILVEAARSVLPTASPPIVLTDGGTENFNVSVRWRTCWRADSHPRSSACPAKEDPDAQSPWPAPFP